MDKIINHDIKEDFDTFTWTLFYQNKDGLLHSVYGFKTKTQAEEYVLDINNMIDQLNMYK
jgi:hypothetical protein